jgi:isoquinoline 1-oxidoreductase alpha subunit
MDRYFLWEGCPVTIFDLQINDQNYSVEADEAMPLLWVLRDLLGLMGTKFSCGMGLCGSCTVLVDNEPVRSCTTPVSTVADKSIFTIEGLSTDASHPIQIAWLDEKVSQCGYCQPGQIMNAVALLKKNPNPSDADIDAAMGDVLCRCGTYQYIRTAIHRAAQEV